MIRDMYSRDATTANYSADTLEVSDTLSQLVLIQNTVNAQIAAYCLPLVNGFTVNTKVQFFSTLERNGALVDIFVNERRVLGALF